MEAPIATYLHESEFESGHEFGRRDLVDNPSGCYIPPYRTLSGRIVSPRVFCPLSRDHLLRLVEYNIFRAISTNLHIIGSKLEGPFCRFGGNVPLFPVTHMVDLPGTLKPTPLQQSSKHDSWIDLLPSPRWRDNAIRLQDMFSQHDLCSDILGGLSGRQNKVHAGTLVWSDPWDPNGWEISEGFSKKWGFLIEGCDDLFRSTNRWREIRGEEPLFA